jgi:hypothetical protein
MRYVAMQILGNQEIQGIITQLDDLDESGNGPIFNYDDRDVSLLARRFSQFLHLHNYIPDDQGKIPILVFGVIPFNLLLRMEMFSRYFNFEGGCIHNPNLFLSNNKIGVSYMKYSEKPYKIVEMVRKHYLKKSRVIK